VTRGGPLALADQLEFTVGPDRVCRRAEPGEPRKIKLEFTAVADLVRHFARSCGRNPPGSHRPQTGTRSAHREHAEQPRQPGNQATKEHAMTSTELQILDTPAMTMATGGRTDPPQPDFASRYVNNVKQDALDFWHRAQGTAADLKSHNWLGAAKNFGGELLDEVGTVGDAIAPFRALM
jgi:hypothetical protein